MVSLGHNELLASIGSGNSLLLSSHYLIQFRYRFATSYIGPQRVNSKQLMLVMLIMFFLFFLDKAIIDQLVDQNTIGKTYLKMSSVKCTPPPPPHFVFVQASMYYMYKKRSSYLQRREDYRRRGDIWYTQICPRWNLASPPFRSRSLMSWK